MDLFDNASEDSDMDSAGDSNEEYDEDSDEEHDVLLVRVVPRDEWSYDDVPLDVLVAWLDNPDFEEGERHLALLALSKWTTVALTPHADSVVARLEDTTPDVRRAALQVLCRLTNTTLAQYGDVLIARLGDADAEVRRRALAVLSRLELAMLTQLQIHIFWPLASTL